MALLLFLFKYCMKADPYCLDISHAILENGQWKKKPVFTFSWRIRPSILEMVSL